MKRRNLITSLAVVALLCLGAVAAYYLLRGPSPVPSTVQAPETTETPAPSATTPPSGEKKAADAPVPAEEKAADGSAPSGTEAAGTSTPPDKQAADSPVQAEDESAAAPSTSEDETTDTASPQQSTSEDVPSFDVVRIEPTGEGVIAGRATPGWKIIVESRGVKVAEAAADDQGEWTIVLDRPLSPGGHKLSLKAQSPDGSQKSSGKQTVSADIAAPRPVGATGPDDVVQPAAGTVAMASKPGEPAPSATASGVPAPQAAKPRAAAPERAVAPSTSTPPLAQTAAIQEDEATPPSSLPPQDRPGTYTILPGDTLWDIAQRYLGAGWRYKTIFRDNRKIIHNPNLIYPEQKMTIAEPPGEPN
jgi:nucleoid-associated protein YgaU